jgi:nucleotide sugar dehydrogenase
MRVCVIGLGKMGLPLAAQYASKGFSVIGCDVSEEVVKLVNSGVSHVKDEPELDDKVKNAVAAGKLSATTDTVSAVRSSDVVVVIVPLVVDSKGKIKYTIIDSVTKKVAAGLKKGALVIYETTLPTGDTRKRFAPMLEKSGLKAGVDFHLVFSPERISSGVTFDYLRNIPKIVGGLNDESTKKGAEFYGKVLDAKIISLSSCEAAESAKLFDMIYRDVNIALANEFARFCDARSLDVLEIVAAANSNPFSKLLLPGVGVGGHCTPVYPYFLIKKAADAGVDLSLAKMARKIHDSMPSFTVSLLKKDLGSLKKKNILVLGLAFRGNVKETFKSPAYAVMGALKKAGANVFLNDPLFSKEEIEKAGGIAADMQNLGRVDGVVLVTYHREYKNLNFSKLAAAGVRVFVDGRNSVDKNKVEEAGIAYRGIGRYLSG